MSRELASLVEASRAGPDPSPEELDRVRNRLALVVAATSPNANGVSASHLLRAKPALGIFALVGAGALAFIALHSDLREEAGAEIAASEQPAPDQPDADPHGSPPPSAPAAPPSVTDSVAIGAPTADRGAAGQNSRDPAVVKRQAPIAMRTQGSAAIAPAATDTNLDVEVRTLSAARAQLSQGAPAEALKILRAQSFTVLRGSALALRAIGLCRAGSRAQGRRAGQQAAGYKDAERLLPGVARACDDGEPASTQK